jgi:hypothetical protein
MKIIWATLGNLALKVLLAILTVLLVAGLLFLMVPAVFPVPFDFRAALALTGLMFLAKAVFK